MTSKIPLMDRLEELLEKKTHYDRLGIRYLPMLTDHQKEIFEEAFFNDLSLSEIAEQQGISRQAVSDQLKRILSILDDLEQKLGVVKQEEFLLEGLEQLRQKETTDTLLQDIDGLIDYLQH